MSPKFELEGCEAYPPSFHFWHEAEDPISSFISPLSLHLRPLNSCIIAKLCDPTRPSLPPPSPSHLPPPSSPLFQIRNEQVGDFPLSHSKMNSKPPGQLGWISGQSEISADRPLCFRVSVLVHSGGGIKLCPTQYVIDLY